MSTELAAPSAPSGARTSTAGLLIGPILFAFAVFAATRAGGDAVDQWLVVGTVAWTATWWFTEALPIAATSLLPAVLLPATGVLDAGDAYARYADGVVLLFLGGFVVALAIERHGLHRRAALATLAVAGTGPRTLLASVMAVTAVLSAWISNTAAAMLMLPIVAAVVAHEEAADDDPAAADRLARALLLGLAYSATLGGLATLIGTPPNAILASLAGDLTGTEVGFARWMLFAMPMSISLLVATWLLLAFVAFRLPARFVGGDVARTHARTQLHGLGTLQAAERRVLAVFLAMAAAWATRPLWADALPVRVDDTTIALVAALACFALPAGRAGDGGGSERLVRWHDTERLPWGVLLLLGGGLALAEAFTASGLDATIGESLSGLDGLSDWIVVASVALVSIAVTEVASNTASAAALIPLAAAVGTATGVDPLALAIAATVGASCGFMMPAGTPPIALAFSTGRLRVATLVRVGIVVNLLSALVITLAVATGVQVVWG